MSKADIAFIGLATMGKNLILNMADHGWSVAVFNRTTSKVDEFIANEAAGRSIVPTHSIEELISSIESPRKVMLMVKAGDAVDNSIEEILPHLSPGDIIIDGGNSHFEDTEKRIERCSRERVHFLGVGVSGGEKGARFGPSIMPGGDKSAWLEVSNILTSISAKAHDKAPCCEWIERGGAGHFVKMVHNGIEYGDMQLIAETYHILKRGFGIDNSAIADIFEDWNRGSLNSYLIEITSDVLRERDSDGSYLTDKILDVAGQKGTGQWTSVTALENSTPLTLITEAVFARSLSARIEERRAVSSLFPIDSSSVVSKISYKDLENALYAGKIISYSQGFSLLSDVSKKRGWNLNYSTIAKIWREGCIIRSSFLDKLAEGLQENPNQSLLQLQLFYEPLKNGVDSLRKVVSAAIELEIPLPTLSSALSYFDTLRQKELPTSLIQGQRDLFGAHTYERRDMPRGEFFHTEWGDK